MAFKVVVSDYDFGELSYEEEVFNKSGLDIELVKAQCHTAEEVLEVAKDANAILNQYAPLNAKVIEELTNCKVLSRYGVGVDTIDLPSARKKGIVVTNVPDYGIEEVSNHAVALMLTWSRKIVELDTAVKNGVWDFRVGTPINRFNDQVFAVLGFGRIPRRVIEKVSVFGFKLAAYDPFVSEEEMAKYSVQKMELDEILKAADVLSVHVPLLDSTHHLINDETIATMKDHVLIVNTARGPIIEEKAIIKALKEKKIGGVALDVTEFEPINRDSELLTLPNVIITPHSAWYSEEAKVELRRKAALNIVKVLKGETTEYQIK